MFEGARKMQRLYMQCLIEEQGFTAHLAYQRHLFCSCRAVNIEAISLENSWEQAAKEWIINRGQVLINERVFFQPATYRSALLDELAIQRSCEGDPPGFPLHPAERLLEKNMLCNDAVNSSILNNAQALKGRKFYTGHLTLASSADVIREFFHGACKERGFVLKKNKCVKYHALGSIRIAIDFGTWRDTRNLIFIMEMEDASSKRVWRIPFDLFVPGFYCYFYLQSDFDLEHLVFAVLAFGDAFLAGNHARSRVEMPL